MNLRIKGIQAGGLISRYRNTVYRELESFGLLALGNVVEDCDELATSESTRKWRTRYLTLNIGLHLAGRAGGRHLTVKLE